MRFEAIFCAVFQFSQNFDAFFRFLTFLRFLRFAVSSIFVRLFVFCRIFVRFFTEISSGFSVVGGVRPLKQPNTAFCSRSMKLGTIVPWTN